MKEPNWIEEEVVLAVHSMQIAEHGGFDGIRDEGLMQSAIARPQHLYAYEAASIPRLAASYAYGIARNHPFLDGNKRTALVICRLFLKVNGYDLKTTQEDKYTTFLSLAAGELTEEQLAGWIEANIAPLNRSQ